jgi:hypothetical protein
MDGAEPPHCPYTDIFTEQGVAADGSMVVLQLVRTHWNDDDVSSASVSLSIAGHVSIAAIGADTGGTSIRTLRVYRPTDEAVVGVMVDLVAALRA